MTAGMGACCAQEGAHVRVRVGRHVAWEACTLLGMGAPEEDDGQYSPPALPREWPLNQQTSDGGPQV